MGNKSLAFIGDKSLAFICTKNEASFLASFYHHHFPRRTVADFHKVDAVGDCLNQNDLDWKTWHSGATLAEYKALAEAQIVDFTEDEKLDFVAARILREHRAAFEELAK